MKRRKNFVETKKEAFMRRFPFCFSRRINDRRKREEPIRCYLREAFGSTQACTYILLWFRRCREKQAKSLHYPIYDYPAEDW